MLKITIASLLAAAALYAEHPTGPRMTPPTLSSVTPLGAARGTTVEMTVEGLNLAGASGVHFSEPGIKGRILRVKELPDLPDIRLGSNGTPSTIDVGPLPPRNQVTLELEIDPEANVGPVDFRLVTPLGSSPTGRFAIEPYYGEAPDREPNDTPAQGFEAFLPAVFAGAISRPGDTDFFQFHVEAGEEIVFRNQGAGLGSSLQPVIALLDASEKILRQTGYKSANDTGDFSYRFDKAGAYYLRITDYEGSGRASHFYRILAGRLPVAVSAFPLGVRRDAKASIAIEGFNLPAEPVSVNGAGGDQLRLRPATPNGPAFNEVLLALGDDPEVPSTGSNRDAASAQALTLPVTVNGKLTAPAWFRFHARKGQQVVIEVEANRLGSPLDPVAEVLDAAGKPIERAVARATWETFTVLRDHDSVQPGMRIQAWNLLNVGDYVLIGNEIARVSEVPDGPDEDMVTERLAGRRRAYFGTSSEAHGIDRAVHKVQIHPAGSTFSPNGLPLVRLYYRNDDGPGYGKDSLVDFTAPADADYFVKLADVRGFTGKHLSYRLHVREPRPSFTLSANPRNPNVPRGGVIPVTVTTERFEGFNGPIEVKLHDLPAAINATTNTIAEGQNSCTILLSAAENATLPAAMPFRVSGTAQSASRAITRWADPEADLMLVAVAPKPDITVEAVTRVVEIEPGQTAEVQLRVTRHNGFAGRVPIEVRDLPDRVRVTDSGLNGVLVNENESDRGFTIWALPNAAPVEGRFYVSGRVETRSAQQNSYAAPQSIIVRVKPAQRRAE